MLYVQASLVKSNLQTSHHFKSTQNATDHFSMGEIDGREYGRLEERMGNFGDRLEENTILLREINNKLSDFVTNKQFSDQARETDARLDKVDSRLDGLEERNKLKDASVWAKISNNIEKLFVGAVAAAMFGLVINALLQQQQPTVHVKNTTEQVMEGSK